MKRWCGSMLVACSVAFGSAGLSLTTGASAETTDLQPHFKEGRSTRYKFWTVRQSHHTRSIGNRSDAVSSSYTVEGELAWAVDQVRDDGSALCQMAIDWITLSVTAPDGSISRTDSRQHDGADEHQQRRLEAMTSAPLTFEVSSQGNVVSVEGTDAMREAAGDDVQLPDDLDFIESASDLVLVASAPPAAEPGDDWHVDFEWTHRYGRMHQDMTYRLSGVESVAGIAVATVDGAAPLDLKVDRSKFPTKGPSIEIRLLDGEVKSQIMFDLFRHETVGRDTLENRTVQITVDFPGGRGVTVSKEQIHSQVIRIAEE